jgi:hypothetical protein
MILRGVLAVINCHRKAGDFVGSLYSSSTICFSDALYRKTLLETALICTLQRIILVNVIYSFLTYYFNMPLRVIGIHAFFGGFMMGILY